MGVDAIEAAVQSTRAPSALMVSQFPPDYRSEYLVAEMAPLLTFSKGSGLIIARTYRQHGPFVSSMGTITANYTSRVPPYQSLWSRVSYSIVFSRSA